MVGVAALRATFPGPAAYARTVHKTALRVEGVAHIATGVIGWLRETPGVLVEFDSAGQLHIVIRIVVHFGCDAVATGIHVQQAVAAAMKRAATETVARIDVVIAGSVVKDSTSNFLAKEQTP